MEFSYRCEAITEALWPGVAVVPTMGTTAADGLYLRRAGIPVYGISGVSTTWTTYASTAAMNASTAWFFDGLEFSYRLIKRLRGGEPP